MKKIFLIFLLLFIARFSQAVESDDWQTIYSQIRTNYINDIAVSDLAVSALKEITAIDKNLRLANDNNRLSLYYQGKVIKVLTKPADANDTVAWGKITFDVISSSLQASPQAEEKSFRIVDAFAQGMLKTLDKDSEFYSSMDDAEGIIKRNHRHWSYRLLDDNILYIKISAINKQTKNELLSALQEHNDASKLIIDLRGCLGGMAGEAIKIADLFLNSGIIVSTQGKDPQKQTFYNADEDEIFTDKKIEILTDSQTASAAEILTAALQDQSRATIIGQKTFGKGTMQKLILLPSGGVLAVTSGYFYAPSGRSLNGNGITPDIIEENPYQNQI